MSTAAVPDRRERRRRETADRVVEAAGALFAERGVAATTVTEICARADVARQTFFNHFASKQELVEALARIGHEFFLDALETAQREGRSTGERLGLLFAQIHAAARASGPMHRDLVAETVRAAYDVASPAHTRSLHAAVEKLLRAGRRQGDVSRRHALEDQRALVIGALTQLLIDWTHREGFPIAERAAGMARLLADALAPH